MRRQIGAILPFCLVFLALLGLMAVAGLESLLLHERMLANAEALSRWLRGRRSRSARGRSGN